MDSTADHLGRTKTYYNPPNNRKVYDCQVPTIDTISISGMTQKTDLHKVQIMPKD